MLDIPPSYLVPMRIGSNLKPPLGDRDPETRHLNLRWTVGDFHRRNFMEFNAGMTFEEVAEKLRGTSLQCEVSYLREIASHFGLKLKPSLYEARR